MKERFLKAVGKYEGLTERTKELQTKIEDSIIRVSLIEDALNNLFGFNEWINGLTRAKLESITNAALKTIFPDKEMYFRVMPNRTKKGIFYDLFIETNGVMTELLDAKGGGVLDVIQMCLRITYLNKMQGKLRQTLILDEPLKNLDAERIGLAAYWLKNISQIFGIQFIIVTHIPALTMTLEQDGIIEVRYADGQSHIM
jgi:hypothetical protein